MTSVDDVTTCSSVFASVNQLTGCEKDTDCTGLLGLGVDMVCVNLPCHVFNFDKVCVNKGCENLFARRDTSRAARNASAIRQLDLRSRKNARTG